MDTTDPEITFNEAGECNHCRTWKAIAPKIMRSKDELTPIIEKIKKSRRGYNCVLGISGGVDSSYTAYLAHKLGLKAVLVHLDNGWDTDEAKHNIERIREVTGWKGVNIYVDSEEYRDIQLAYLKAGVINLEAITDHAIASTIYSFAYKEKFRYVLSGQNWATEGILPQSWGFAGRDLANIKDIHRKYGTIPMREFSGMGIVKRLFIEYFASKTIKPLNYVDYNRADAMKTLVDEWELLDYGGKHGESRLTRFYQEYILPTRWGIDKRKAHLSTLICSGQLTRDEALETLSEPPSNNPSDYAFFSEKMGMTPQEVVDTPKRAHLDYKNEEWVLDILRQIRGVIQRRK